MRTMDHTLFPARPACRRTAVLLLLTLATMLPVAWAQTPAPTTAKPLAAKSATRGVKAHAAKSKSKTTKESAPAPAPAATIATAPIAPKLPDWPVNNKPTQAIVVWNSAGLHVIANNASLRQIIGDIAQATGATVEGNVPEERVFGDFGPGKARDVLAKLLDGSGNNVLLIGDQGSGTPRRIVINTHADGMRTAYAAPNAQAKHSDDDDDDDAQPEEEQPQPPPSVRNGFGGQQRQQGGQQGGPQGRPPQGEPPSQPENNPE
jgi:hypothetical protein